MKCATAIAIPWNSVTMVGPTLGILLYQLNPQLLWITVTGLSFLAAALVLASPRKPRGCGIDPGGESAIIHR